MNIISRARGHGKTAELAKMMLDDPGLVFLAPTHHQARIGHTVAQSLLPPGAVISPSRFIKVPDDLTTLAGRRVVIDEFDGALGPLLGGATVEAVAFTPDDQKEQASG